MAKWNHEPHIVVRANDKWNELTSGSLPDWQAVLESIGNMAEANSANLKAFSQHVRRLNLVFDLMDWHIPEGVAYWLVKRLPDWLFF